MKIQNALVSNILDRSQRYFAHVTTVTLSWRVQNIVVIGRVYFPLECFEFSSNFEFDRNMLSGTGARAAPCTKLNSPWKTWLKFRRQSFCILIAISLKFVPKGPTDNIPRIGLDNGLAPNRQQTIIWTNADLIHWCKYAALGGDLMKWG